MSTSSDQVVNLLFTSAGRRVELLRAFRDAYKALDLRGNIVATDIDPLAPALQIVDKPYLVPYGNSNEFIPTLVEICSREKISMVFPLIDPDIPVLALWKDALEATGARLAVVSEEAARIANDKWRTSEFFKRLGLMTAQAWLPETFDQAAAFPVFIKPRNGSAGRHTYKINNEEELSFFRKYVPNPIIEEYLPGPEITSDVLTSVDGEVLAVVSRQRVEVRSGEVAKGVTIINKQIIDACLAISSSLPAIGPITVQCLMKDEKPYFTEINARFGGGIPLAIAAGVEFPKWLLARAVGIPINIPPVGTYESGVYLTRFDESFFLRGAELEKMASHRL